MNFFMVWKLEVVYGCKSSVFSLQFQGFSEVDLLDKFRGGNLLKNNYVSYVTYVSYVSHVVAEGVEKGTRGTQTHASSRLAAIESPLSFCRPRPTRWRVWNDRDGSFTLIFQYVNVFFERGHSCRKL